MHNEHSTFETLLLAIGIALALAGVMVGTYFAGLWLWRRLSRRNSKEAKV